MHQGNWTCSTCGGAITELPFQPRSNTGLTCRECYFKTKNGGSGSPTPAPEPQTATDFDDRNDVPPPDPDEYGIANEPAPPPPDDLDGAVPTAPGERKMFTGDWACAGCGAAITQLPFQPRDTSNLKCLDCFKKSKG